jgi:hypothetical protein
VLVWIVLVRREEAIEELVKRVENVAVEKT